MDWRLIEDDIPDIHRSLAISEALAKVASESQKKVSTLRFWHCDPAVVMGRFQCLHNEVNTDYCSVRGIQVARRFTGGGTVYLDRGTLNFDLCLDQNEPSVCRTLRELYWNFIGNISVSLREAGIDTQFDSERSCVRINGRKVTGTAGWIKRGVSFIHGTIMVSTSLPDLEEAIRPRPGQTKYFREPAGMRCMDSKRDIVTSIREQYPQGPSEKDIRKCVIGGLERFTERRMSKGGLTREELAAAESLYRDQYSRPEWNLGVPTQETT